MTSKALVPVSVRTCGHPKTRDDRCFYPSCYDREETLRAKREGAPLTACGHPLDYADNARGLNCVHFAHR